LEVGENTGSFAASGEYSELPDELWALFSRRSLPRRLKIVLPKICTLSGRSRDGMLLDVDLPEDFLDKLLIPSSAVSHEGLSPDASDRSEEDPDELAWWLWCLSRPDARFICLLSARMLSGEGGPSIAGSRRSVTLEAIWLAADEGCDVSVLVVCFEALGVSVDFDFFAAFCRRVRSSPYTDDGGYAHIFMIKRGCAMGRCSTRVYNV
jgi:hypothetical protein